MLATNGYRIYSMTRSNAIARAERSIATYQKALDTGLTFDGQEIPADMVPALKKMIEGQKEVIKEWKAMRFRPGEW